MLITGGLLCIAVGQKIDDLAERLKEHGIDVEHPAGTGPVKKETIGGFVQGL